MKIKYVQLHRAITIPLCAIKVDEELYKVYKNITEVHITLNLEFRKQIKIQMLPQILFVDPTLPHRYREKQYKADKILLAEYRTKLEETTEYRALSVIHFLFYNL